MKKIDLLNKIIYTTIFTVFAMIVFMAKIQAQNVSFYQNYTDTYIFFMELWLSFKEFDIAFLTLGMFVYYTFYNIYLDTTPLTKKSLVNATIAILLSFITLVGKSYKIDNTLGVLFSTPAQMVKCTSMGIGYYLIYYAIIKKISSIKLNIKPKKKNKIIEKICKFINKFHIPIFLIIILLGWLPYIICYYPGASTGDTFDSLCQFFHLEKSWSIKTIDLLNENMYINKHHSVLFTVILGNIFSLGYVNNSYTTGAFIYTIFQITFMLVILGFMFYYMKKIKLPLWIRVSSAIFLSLTPPVAAYAITAIKDTPNAMINLVYVIFLIQIIRNYDSIFKHKKRLIALILVMLLVMMLRNNGIYTIILSFPFLILIYKPKWKKITITLLIVLTTFCLYDKVLLPKLDITEGSIKETLTIPFMQIARVAHFNNDEFTEKEKEIINKVLDYKQIEKNYQPDLADSVKDTYKKDATKEELKDFFKLWFKYLIKHPIIYTESLINSTYGYFFPEAGEKYAYLAVDSRVGKGTYFNILKKEERTMGRETIHKVNELAAVFPFTFLFNHVAFYDWFLIFSMLYVVRKKQAKYLIALAPLLSVLLVCIASPINGSFRYILPIVISIPMILAVDYLAYKECKKIKM